MKYSIEDMKSSPETGVNIHGLFIQGCRWDWINLCLEESLKKELFTLLPVIWLDPI